MSDDIDFVKEAMDALKKSIDGDVCHVCNGHIKQKVQIGRCVYAEPCNHRLYQGTIKPNT